SFTARQWSAPPAAKKSECCGTASADQAMDTETLDGFLEQVKVRMLSVSCMAFQDAWNLDLERVRDCCIHVVAPDGRMIPFCLYNLTSINGESLYRGKFPPNPLS
ncbi:MAG TPA: hypothetical protein PLI53_04360, partial [Geobacteraceae bacterium]|nr:hypothetical protein [Geobacteraceae bacterium]